MIHQNSLLLFINTHLNPKESIQSCNKVKSSNLVGVALFVNINNALGKSKGLKTKESPYIL